MLNRNRTFNFGQLYFWYSYSYKIIKYLIWKLSLMVIRNKKARVWQYFCTLLPAIQRPYFTTKTMFVWFVFATNVRSKIMFKMGAHQSKTQFWPTIQWCSSKTLGQLCCTFVLTGARMYPFLVKNILPSSLIGVVFYLPSCNYIQHCLPRKSLGILESLLEGTSSNKRNRSLSCSLWDVCSVMNIHSIGISFI